MTLKTNQETNQQLYYVKLPASFNPESIIRFLNLNLRENTFFFNNEKSNISFKTKFNNSELEDIQERLPFLNIGMLKVPVEDAK